MNTEQFLRNLWRLGQPHFTGEIVVCTDGTVQVLFRSMHGPDEQRQRLTVTDNTITPEPPR